MPLRINREETKHLIQEKVEDNMPLIQGKNRVRGVTMPLNQNIFIQLRCLLEMNVLKELYHRRVNSDVCPLHA